MPKTLQYVLACYRVLLWLYPADLRRVYGKEMTAVFEEVLRQQWTDHGVRGLVASGSRAFTELLTVAIPGQLVSEWMMIVGLSLAINLGVIVLEALFFVRRGF
jgi:hypothetical protein